MELLIKGAGSDLWRILRHDEELDMGGAAKYRACMLTSQCLFWLLMVAARPAGGLSPVSSQDRVTASGAGASQSGAGLPAPLIVTPGQSTQTQHGQLPVPSNKGHGTVVEDDGHYQGLPRQPVPSNHDPLVQGTRYYSSLYTEYDTQSETEASILPTEEERKVTSVDSVSRAWWGGAYDELSKSSRSHLCYAQCMANCADQYEVSNRFLFNLHR